MHPSLLFAAAAVPALVRGIHAYRAHPSGETVWYGILSTGELLNGEIRHRASDETEAMIVAEMARDLDRQDDPNGITDRPGLRLHVDGERAPRGPSSLGRSPY